MTSSAARAAGARGSIVALALALAGNGVAVAASGCGPSRTLDPSRTAPVRIGLIVPLDGEGGASGESWRDAVRLAVREVDSAGGVLPGQRVELLIEDSGSTTEGAVAAYHRLDAQGVVAIVGDASSSGSIAVLNEITASDRPVLLGSPSATSTLLTELDMGPPEDRWFFRAIPSDAEQAPALANAMADGDLPAIPACTRTAILHVDDDYGQPFAASVSAQLESRGVTVAATVPFQDGLGSYDAEVAMVAAASPDCIALIAYPQAAGTIVRAWSLLSMPPAVHWYGTDGVRESGFVTQVGDPSLIDGFRGTAPLTESLSPAYNRFRDRFEATFGSTPVAFGSNHYDAAALILLAIARAGSTDPGAIRDAVHELSDPAGTVVQAGVLEEGIRLIRLGRAINYDGSSGPVDVDEYGEVDGPYELWEFTASDESFHQVRILP